MASAERPGEQQRDASEVELQAFLASLDAALNGGFHDVMVRVAGETSSGRRRRHF